MHGMKMEICNNKQARSLFTSKFRQDTIYGKLRKKIGSIIRDLCRQKGIELLEGHAMPDHIHLCLSIPPKYGVSNTISG
ncbi:IS200/IS605 family transposase [Desulfosarcina variabilis]|uniref:IS200/IS605 family transposase n=1 Tax=Desulfosarcina variabilis TaxID=2300 RepID=UPI003AFB0D22